MRKPQTKPDWQKDIAMERIVNLFSLAEKEFREKPERSARYIELASKIGMRYNVRIPVSTKRKFCKHCHAYLSPGVSSKVRKGKDGVVVTCLSCGRPRRYGIPKRRLSQRKKAVHA
jgi:ribonuclease P protein subunit RPR2